MQANLFKPDHPSYFLPVSENLLGSKVGGSVITILGGQSNTDQHFRRYFWSVSGQIACDCSLTTMKEGNS